ncbi:hypothetical protein [Paramagnetospirillum kuznetsovii]|uniref:hypothetical protein n=1 Tax=Paramagnetospirillum kuznetsovii TaxID=2053833 RepID=UPI0011BF4697|nr:hypothetical protein [Paramagnetospirillum kuznetsovii]
MSLDGIIGSDGGAGIRSVQGASRSGAIRAVSESRPNFELPDTVITSRRPGSQPRDTFVLGGKKDDAASSSFQGRPQGRDGSSDTGREPTSTFLAQSLAQDSGGGEPVSSVSSRLRAGIDAYVRAAGTTTANADLGVEVLPPSGASLASGHVLDLAI